MSPAPRLAAAALCHALAALGLVLSAMAWPAGTADAATPATDAAPAAIVTVNPVVLKNGADGKTLLLRVTAPREPCFKFNAVMGFSQAARLMAVHARCGFYLSVAQPGTLEAGETFRLVSGQRALSIAQAIRGKLAKHLR